MGWWHSLFGAHPPEDPPENQETHRLLEEARRLSHQAKGALPDRDAIAYEAKDAALAHGYNDRSPLVALLTDLGLALLDAATVTAVPNDLTVQQALRDVLAGAELRERLRDTLEYLRDAEHHHDLILSVLRDILYEAAGTLHAPTEEHAARAPFCVPLLTYLEDPAEAVSGTIGRLYWDDVRSTPLFRKLRDQLTNNLEVTHERNRAKTVQELVKKYPDPQALITDITHDTPFFSFLFRHAPLCHSSSISL